MKTTEKAKKKQKRNNKKNLNKTQAQERSIQEKVALILEKNLQKQKEVEDRKNQFEET